MATIYTLEAMTWPEARLALSKRPVGLLPIGAIEAHGPHLPLDSDVIIACATAQRAAEILAEEGVSSVILPPIAYSVSFVGTSFAGTSPVDAQAFEAYLTSVLVHAANQGYRALICCNAHLEPAHVATIQTACGTAESRSGIPVRSPDQRDAVHAARLGAEFIAGARHAGAYETSIVLHAQPGAVRQSELGGLQAVWIDLPARLREGALTFLDTGSQLGYFGNPATASAAEGERLLQTLGEIIVNGCRDAGVL